MAATKSKPRRLYLIDGSGYIFRAFHALPPMTRTDGTPVNAVYGFASMLLKLLDDLRDDSVEELIAVVFDTARKTFRNEIYKDYKAHRPPPPEELIPQFALIREATRAFNVPAVELAGYEADDLIATYARLAEAQGIDVVVVSGDKDLMQLVRGGVKLRDPIKNRDIGPDEVKEKFGVGPEKVIDVQALAGDSTDNVPGVPGIGVKTAAELIGAYGDLETLLKRAGEIKQPKRRENLQANAELARISKQLVTLKDDVPVPAKLDELVWRAPEADTLLGFLQAQNFKSLTAKVAAKLGAEPPAEAPNQQPTHPHPIPLPRGEGASRSEGVRAGAVADIAALPFDRSTYETVQTADALKGWVAAATANGWVAVDTETDGLDPLRANLVGVSLCVAPGKACYVPLRHGQTGAQGALDLSGESAPDQVPVKDAIALLKPMLEDPAVLKIGHNIKFDLHVFARLGVDVAPVDDTIVMSYVLDGAKTLHNMDDLAALHFGHATIKFSDVCGSG
ncbi:MAG: 5'-3' exonuclease H3TH domain-containing protein, partial [Rhodospirillaceae bacterium]|nr:5'-3' exonuclease H3TH domain-containing protein [Rhodospirillaceae bacterium]